MVVVINGIRGGVSWTNFTIFVETPEAAFDKLSAYVSKGLILLNARLIDDSGRMELPVEIFDGQAFVRPIQRLQQQWEHILGDRSIRNRQRFKAWDDQLITYYEKQMGQFGRIIEQLESAARKNAAMQTSPKRIRLAQQYALLLQRHNQQLAAIRIAHQEAVDHLHRLKF